jgi:hypothetical protein
VCSHSSLTRVIWRHIICGPPACSPAPQVYLNLDDCWIAENRTADGKLTYDLTRFPSGMSWLGKQAHSRKLKLGLYAAASVETCRQYPGSQGYEEVDAATFAEWGAGTPRLSHHRIDAFPQRDPYNMAERSSPLLCSQTLPS